MRCLHKCKCRKTEDDYPPHNLSYENECGESADIESSNGSREASVNPCVKVLKLQNGVLRTNCIDCLDRTNIAQYAYGLVALGYQLQILGLINTAYIGLDDPLAVDLMDIYETMGDTLSLQYGGSAAHNKVLLIVFGFSLILEFKKKLHSSQMCF